MKALKKASVDTLRQGAGKGEKVLYVWDRAGIDFRQCFLWKHNSGVYLLSRTKRNMKLDTPLPIRYDKTDPVNEGVTADENVSNRCGTMIRRVSFRIPETGEIMEFITTLGPSIPPGVVAQLYFMRWRIEKSFDEIKNKLHETKAWAMSPTAKRMQAAFIVTAYNLAQLLHSQIESQHRGPQSLDTDNEKKRARRLEELTESMTKDGRQLPLLRQIYRKPSQLGVKFYRWLRKQLHDPASWQLSQQRLLLIYESF